MKSGSWKADRKYDRARPETSITSWAISVLVFGSIIGLAVSPPLEATQSPRQTCRPRPQLGYWISQSAGWLAYALLCTISGWITDGHAVGYFLSGVVMAVIGFLITHWFRWLILRLDWLSLAPGALVFRVIAAIPVLSLLLNLLNYLEAPLESYLVGRPATFEYANQHFLYLLCDFFLAS